MSGPVEQHAGRAAVIADLSLALAGLTRDTPLLEREVVRRVGELVGDATALWRKDDEGQIQLVAFAHRDPRAEAYMQRTGPTATPSAPDGLLTQVWRAGAVLRIGRGRAARGRALHAARLPGLLPAYGGVSLVVVPLRVRGSVVALLGVWRDAPPVHDDDDVVLRQPGRRGRGGRAGQRPAAAPGTGPAAGAEPCAPRRAPGCVHDQLTGLPNRRLLMERLHAVASRDRGEVALLLVDLDGFKDLNDAYGHATGDAVLVEVADRLQRALRRSPLGRSSTLARLGGDEFAVLAVLPGGSGLDGPAEPGDALDALPRHVLSALEPPLDGVRHARVSASIGVARGAAGDAHTLLRHADIAMYRAKRARLGWAHFTPEQDAGAEVRLREIGELDEALVRGELRLEYQPIVPRPSAGSLARRGVEALVRWEHPTRGLLPPAAFLPLAAQTFRMSELTRWVVATAVQDLASWRRRGLDVQVSVNVGADVLTGPTFHPELVRVLDRAGLPHELVCLELTESEVLSPEGPGLLARARETGVRVALDDFGTGYSSLAHLADLPLDRLKLDRSFVRRLSADPRMARLVRGLVDLVHELGYPVVAEGVEDAREVALLDALDVEYQQGFWHSRPLAPAALLAHWASGGD